MSWSTPELRVRLVVWNRFKPSNKIIFWPFQGGTSFVDHFFLYCVCYAFVRVCLFVPCGHLLGKGWPLGCRLLCLTVSLSLSHGYPGSDVVLDCFDSWSLHPYLLCSYNDLRLIMKVRKTAKIRNGYNQVPLLTQDTTWKSDKITVKHYKQEPRGQPFPSWWPQGSNEQTQKHGKHKT